MKKNIDTTGRIIRGTIGISLLGIAYWKMSWIVLLAGAFTLFEALMSWCIFYQMIGKSSCPRSKR